MEHSTPGIALLIVLFVGPVIFFIRQAVQGRQIFIRRIPGIDAIDEAVGRSVELGRPISFTTALTGIGPLFAACLGVMRYVAGKAARFNNKLFVPCGDPESLVLADAVVQSAYRKEKRYSNYDPTSLRYLSGEQFAFASGYIGLVQRENVGAGFLFGSFAAESLILAEAGQRIGAVQVAATVDSAQIPFFITVCDYTLIGEELFSAGAYLSGEPVLTGSVRGQDFGKLVLLLLLLIGILQATYFSARGEHPEQLPIEKWIQVPWTKAEPSATQ
ncbi:MAG: DUF6754 domain-containing protein [Bdellovibrionota bacterium]